MKRMSVVPTSLSILAGSAAARLPGTTGLLPVMVSLTLGAVSACSFAPTWPPMPLPETMTRQDIDHFRAREQDRYQNALRECYQRFAVNDCRREALTQHNEVQHQLRAQELRLNALDREQRQRKLQASPADGSSGREGAASSSGTPP